STATAGADRWTGSQIGPICRPRRARTCPRSSTSWARPSAWWASARSVRPRCCRHASALPVGRAAAIVRGDMGLLDVAFPYRTKKGFGAASFALVFLTVIFEIESLVLVALGILAQRFDLVVDLQDVILP